MGQTHASAGESAVGRRPSAKQSHLSRRPESFSSEQQIELVSQLMEQLTSLWASDQQCYLKYQPADVIGWRKSGFYIIIIIIIILYIFFPISEHLFEYIGTQFPPTFRYTVREEEFDYNVRFKWI